MTRLPARAFGLALLILLPPALASQQPNSAAAALVIRCPAMACAPSGAPLSTFLFEGAPAAIQVAGAANAPFILASAPALLVPGTPTGAGVLHLDPFGPGFAVLLNGLFPGTLLDNLLGHVDATGERVLSGTLSGALFPGARGFQAAVASASAPLGFVLSAGNGVGFERPLPATGTALSLADDQFVPAPFGSALAFPFYNVVRTSCFVCSNGFLTFGVGDLFPLPSTALMNAGPARVAPLWDDLDPSQAGTVSASLHLGRFDVRWDAVPEFGAFNQNSFGLSLFASGEIVFYYFGIAATHGLVGISGAVQGGSCCAPIDLSASLPFTAAPNASIFEVFAPGTLDVSCLPGSILRFVPLAPTVYQAR